MPERKRSNILPSAQPALSAPVRNQISLLLAEKAARTPAQRKIDSSILYTARMLRGEAAAAGVPLLDTNAELDAKNRLAVDIFCDVSKSLIERLENAEVAVLQSQERYHHIRAMIPADKAEEIASWADVRFISPQRNGITAHATSATGTLVHSAPVAPETKAKIRNEVRSAVRILQATDGSGSVDTEGDVTHHANVARARYGVDGAGLTIGVLSSGVDSLAQSQATGDLGPVTILPGQAGTGDEGTAMLEIVHDIAPGAALYFATAGPSIEQLADNIRSLQAAGCNIILDDVSYFIETPFHGGQSASVLSTNDAGVAIQAVNDVTAAGALYFSAAGNSGNVDSTGSSTWEGDFVAGGPATGVLAGLGDVHLFSAGAPADPVTGFGGPVVLQWADPLGASTNDYDLFLIDPTGPVIVNASTNLQNGTQDPTELLLNVVFPPYLIAIVKHPSANNLFLHMEAFGAQLQYVTGGATFGHNAAENAFGIAATPAHFPLQDGLPSGPYPNPFNSSNVVEPYSADGPRRVFFDADGTPITPGNFTSTGGKVLAKPDFTAADGVMISGAGGFPNPFYGTSAAVPHAAGIAALLLSAKPSLTRADLATALSTTAIDIMKSGTDNSSGAGIIMPVPAIASTGATGFANPRLGTIVASENPGNGDGIITAGEGAKITLQLTNSALVTTGSVTAALTSPDDGVYVTQPAANAYPDLKTGDSATSDFTFTLPANWDDCTGKVNFALTVAYSGGPAATRTLNFSVPVGPSAIAVSGTVGTPVAGLPGITSSSGTQAGRLFRDGNPSTCGTHKNFPLLWDQNPYTFDSLSFTSCRTGCVPFNLNFPSSDSSGTLFASAYMPSFSPADPSVNYAGDAGTSDVNTSFAIDTISGAAVDVVVTDATNTDVGLPYTVTIPGCALTCVAPNNPPVAIAKDVVAAADSSGSLSVNVDNGSYDPDKGDTITLAQSPSGPYSKGSTPVLLTVTDTKGAISQATATVKVVDAVTLTPETNSATVTAGGSAYYTLDVTTAAGAVSFECSGLPSQSNCAFNNFNPGSSGGEGIGTVQLTIMTSASSVAAQTTRGMANGAGPTYALAAMVFGVVLVSGRRRRARLLRMLAASTALLLLAITFGCGGGPSSHAAPNGTPSGTYSVAVKATNSAGAATAVVTLTVK